MWNHTGNILLHKDDVGKSKPPVYQLPPPDFAYGAYNRQPEKGVREVPNANENIKNLIRDSNQKVPKMRVNQLFMKGRPRTVAHAKGKLEIELRLPTEDFKYGIPNRPSTPIKAVINNGYGNRAEQEALEAYAARRGPVAKDATIKSKLVTSTTKATLLSKEITQMKLEKRREDPFAKTKNLFKMSQFKTVKPIVSTKRAPYETKANYHSREGPNKHLAGCLSDQERRSVSKQLEHRQHSLIQSHPSLATAGGAAGAGSAVAGTQPGHSAPAAETQITQHPSPKVPQAMPQLPQAQGPSRQSGQKACCH